VLRNRQYVSVGQPDAARAQQEAFLSQIRPITSVGNLFGLSSDLRPQCVQMFYAAGTAQLTARWTSNWGESYGW
jgi:hypothetical protein